MSKKVEKAEAAEVGVASGGAAPQELLMASAEILQEFADFVQTLGGHPAAMFRECQIDPVVVDDPNGVIPYRSLMRLLETAADELDCPDFGMRLANRQGPAKIVTPIDVAMRNSQNLGEALRYCADHIHVYSNATYLSLESLPERDKFIFRFEIAKGRLPAQFQTIEHALTLMHLAIPSMCAGEARAREIWFTHEPIAPLARYAARLNAPARFGQVMNGLVLDRRDLEAKVPRPDRQLYALATNFIASRFPSSAVSLELQIRMMIRRNLSGEDCTQERIASALGMHPRTLQRRLREEGQVFEAIKDDVRREAALELLGQGRMPLIRVAEHLGYAEVSSLSRSCYRWFSASPKVLRNAARASFSR